MSVLLAPLEAGIHLCRQHLAELLIGDADKYIVDKGGGEHIVRHILGDTPLLHIEERCLIQQTGCQSVSALDIVSIDLQLRLGVHLCLLRE